MTRPALARRCDLIADEATPSWVSRLARINGVTTAREFCLDMGMTLEACVRGKIAALVKLQDLTGTALSSLQWASVSVDGHDLSLRGERLMPRGLRSAAFVLCPCCIADDMQSRGGDASEAAYGRTLWRLSVVRSCARHGSAIVTIPHDPTVSPHDFAAHIQSRRDAILHRADAHPARAISSLQTYAEDRFESRARARSWLDGMPLHATVETCETLGLLVSLGASAWMTRVSEAELHRAGHVGFEIATQGEDAIRAVLVQAQRAFPDKRRSKDGPYTVFGPLYRAMAKRQNDPAFSAILDVLRRHIQETTPVGPGETVLGQPITTRHVHSIQTASRETGRHPKRLRKVLAAAGLIEEGHEAFSDGHVLFNVARADRFLKAEARGLDLGAAAAYLGMTPYQARILGNAGILRSYVEHTGEDDTRRHTFATDDLDAFIARLTENAEAIDRPTDTMLSIPAAAHRTKCEASRVVQWILDGRLAWVGRHTARTQYESILVELREIERYAYALDPDTIPIREAAKLLRKPRSVVDHLIANGLIKTITTKLPSNNLNARLVRQSDVKAFLETHIFLSTIAKEMGTRSEFIANRLNGGAHMINSNNLVMTYYRRDSIPLEIIQIQTRQPAYDVMMTALRTHRIINTAELDQIVKAEGWTQAEAYRAKRKLKNDKVAFCNNRIWTLVGII